MKTPAIFIASMKLVLMVTFALAISSQAQQPPRPTDLLVAGEGWNSLSEGHKFTEGPAADAEGIVYFTDIPNNRIHRIALDGKVTVFAENTSGSNGLMFGPDGLLYACQNGTKRIVAYDKEAKEKVIVEGIESNDIAVSHTGTLYVTDPNNKQVWFINAKREKTVVDKGLGFPNGVRLTPDQSLLLVADSRSQYVYSYHIEPDGSLTSKQPFFQLIIPDGKTDSGADGMTFDRKGNLYVTTHLGVQVCDQAGRVITILTKPQNKWLANAVFGGSEMNYLYLTCSDKVYRRKLNAKGVLSFQPPFLPPQPRL